jgi:hypothetical protein
VAETASASHWHCIVGGGDSFGIMDGGDSRDVVGGGDDVNRQRLRQQRGVRLVAAATASGSGAVAVSKE